MYKSQQKLLYDFLADIRHYNNQCLAKQQSTYVLIKTNIYVATKLGYKKANQISLNIENCQKGEIQRYSDKIIPIRK